MPGQQRTSSSIWIASSIALFLVLTSVCIVLSLSSGSNRQNAGAREIGYKPIEVANYVPNVVMFCVMSFGVLAMVVFIVRRGNLTTDDHEAQLSSRHIRHRKFSLYSLSLFFVGGFIFHLNYVLVEFSCVSRWVECETEIKVLNIFEVIFHFGCMIFVVCETIVCWVMQRLNFKRSPWIWHGLAVVQAANVAQWFDAILEEADHRINHNTDIFGIYFTFCNTTSENRTVTEHEICSKSSSMAYWFGWSIPILFPITIEFFLLVSENFLDRSRSIGAESCSLDQNAGEDNINQDNEASRFSSNRTPIPLRPTDERMPLLNRNPGGENMMPSINSVRSKIFIMITGVINIMYLVLSIIVYLNHQSDRKDQSQTVDNVFTVHVNIYYLFSITCSVVGILSCRKFQRQQLRTSFLEYLLLFSTSGVLLQSVKRMTAFTDNSEVSGWIPVYDTAEILDIAEAPLQIVFYFYAKDALPQLINDDGHYDRGTVFKTTIIILSIGNFTEWFINSFLYANLNVSITPFRYSIEQWPVFDNAVNPISIFFRFNSALLFWCVGTNLQPQPAVRSNQQYTNQLFGDGNQ